VQGPDVEQSAAPACDGDASTDPTAGTHAHRAPRSAAIVVESAPAAAPPSASGSRGGSSAGDVAAVPSSSARSVADELGQEVAAVFKIHTRALLNGASESLAKVVQDLLEEVKEQREKLEEDRAIFNVARFAQRENPWLVMAHTGRLFCTTCSAHYNQVHLQGRWRDESPFLEINLGLDPGDAHFKQKVQRHAASKLHEECTALEEVRAQDPMGHAHALWAQQAEDTTIRVIRTALYAFTNFRPFTDHEDLMLLQAENGVDVGDKLHSRMTSARLLETIYDVQRRDLATFLMTPNKFTTVRPYVGISADKVCDSQFVSFQLVHGRVNHGGHPINFMFSCNPLKDASSNADACLEDINATQSAFGVRRDVQSKTYSFDGEAVYQGEKEGCKGQLLKEDSTRCIIHDPPHATDLLKDGMRQHFRYIDTVHETIRGIYSLYSRSAKRHKGLEATAAELGVDLAQLHYVFEVRMVESETIALKNFLIDLPVIAADLESMIEEARGTTDSTSVHIAKCKMWLRRITEFKFVAVCLVLLDVNIVTRRFSKGTQADDAVVVDLIPLLSSYEATIKQYADGTFGPKIRHNLANLCQGRYGSVQLKRVPGRAAAETAPSPVRALPSASASTFPPVHDGSSATGAHPTAPLSQSHASSLEAISRELQTAPEETLWNVHKIIDHKAAGRGYRFLVWWEKCPRNEATWEPRSHLQPHMIQEYWASLAAPSSDVRTQAPATSPVSAPASAPVPAPASAPAAPPASTVSDDAWEDDLVRSLEEEDVRTEEGPVVSALKQYQALLCKPLLEDMQSRLGLPDVVHHLAKATDFRAMPLEDTSGADASLDHWGNDSVEWICTHRLPHLDASAVKAQLLRVKHFVRDNRDQWVTLHDVRDDEDDLRPRDADGKVTRRTTSRLNLVGDTSIAQSLFTQPERVLGGVPTQFLELMDYMIAFRFNRTSHPPSCYANVMRKLLADDAHCPAPPRPPSQSLIQRELGGT